MKKQVLTIVGKSVEKFGFNYDPEMSDGGILVTFTRITGDIKQVIQIQKERFATGLHLSFGITEPNALMVFPESATEFIPLDRMPPITDFLKRIREQQIENFLTVPEYRVEMEKLGADLKHLQNPRFKYGYYWAYEDKAEIPGILEEFAEIIELYGLDKLNELSSNTT